MKNDCLSYHSSCAKNQRSNFSRGASLLALASFSICLTVLAGIANADTVHRSLDSGQRGQDTPPEVGSFSIECSLGGFTYSGTNSVQYKSQGPLYDCHDGEVKPTSDCNSLFPLTHSLGEGYTLFPLDHFTVEAELEIRHEADESIPSTVRTLVVRSMAPFRTDWTGELSSLGSILNPGQTFLYLQFTDRGGIYGYNQWCQLQIDFLQ